MTNCTAARGDVADMVRCSSSFGAPPEAPLELRQLWNAQARDKMGHVTNHMTPIKVAGLLYKLYLTVVLHLV